MSYNIFCSWLSLKLLWSSIFVFLVTALVLVLLKQLESVGKVAKLEIYAHYISYLIPQLVGQQIFHGNLI